MKLAELSQAKETGSPASRRREKRIHAIPPMILQTRGHGGKRSTKSSQKINVRKTIHAIPPISLRLGFWRLMREHICTLLRRPSPRIERQKKKDEKRSSTYELMISASEVQPHTHTTMKRLTMYACNAAPILYDSCGLADRLPDNALSELNGTCAGTPSVSSVSALPDTAGR